MNTNRKRIASGAASVALVGGIVAAALTLVPAMSAQSAPPPTPTYVPAVSTPAEIEAEQAALRADAQRVEAERVAAEAAAAEAARVEAERVAAEAAAAEAARVAAEQAAAEQAARDAATQPSQRQQSAPQAPAAPAPQAPAAGITCPEGSVPSAYGENNVVLACQLGDYTGGVGQ